MNRTLNCYTGWLACAALAVGLTANVSAQRPGPPRTSVPHRPTPRNTDANAERWTRELISELERLHDDLEERRGDRRLEARVEQALRSALHFQYIQRRDEDRGHIVRDFRELDRQVHDLLRELTRSDVSISPRAIARIRYADEQLHYHLSVRDRGNQETYRELIARHTQLLSQETRRLEQLMRGLPGRGGPDPVRRSLRSFTDELDHFHEVAERNGNVSHLRRDFDQLDESWHRTVAQINRSPAGIVIRRQAQRVNQVHNQLADMLVGNRHDETHVSIPGDRGRGHDHDHDHQRDRRGRERPGIEFEIPGLGRIQLREF